MGTKLNYVLPSLYNSYLGVRWARRKPANPDQPKDDSADQPGQHAAGIGNVVSTRKKPPPKKREAADGASKALKAIAAASVDDVCATCMRYFEEYRVHYCCFRVSCFNESCSFLSFSSMFVLMPSLPPARPPPIIAMSARHLNWRR